MTTCRVQVALERDTALPEDWVVNTFHFGDVDIAVAEAPQLVTRLQTFYSTVDDFLSPLLSGNATAKVYDLSQPEPRVPVYTTTFTVVPGAGSNMPAEIAVCLSYQAALVSGEPIARRRGRLFIGPMSISALGAQVGGDVTVHASCKTALTTAAITLAGDPPLPGQGIWSVYSPKSDETGTLASSTFPIVGGWVDDRFDTQRRRGSKPTSRLIWNN